MRQLKRQREKLLAELKQAEARKQYVKVIDITKKLRDLDNQEVEKERVSYNQLAHESMTKKEISQFTADMIAMMIGCDILQGLAMNVEQHMRRFKNFESPDVIKVKQAVRILADMVKVIDDISKDHPIKSVNGQTYSLSDHFMGMVDEVEQQFYGLNNLINKVVTKTITIDE